MGIDGHRRGLRLQKIKVLEIVYVPALHTINQPLRRNMRRNQQASADRSIQSDC